MQVAGPDKNDHYTDVRADNNSRVCLNNNAAFTGILAPQSIAALHVHCAPLTRAVVHPMPAVDRMLVCHRMLLAAVLSVFQSLGSSGMMQHARVAPQDF